MLAGNSKMREGRGWAKRSRGQKPLLRRRILLDFLDICGMNILSITDILRLIKELELWGLLTLKRRQK